MEGLDCIMAKRSLVFAFLAVLPFSAQALTSNYFSTNAHPLVMEIGFDYLHPTFGVISGVVVQNSATSNVSTPTVGGVNQTYPDVFAQTLGVKFLMDEEKKMGLTFQSYLPLNSLTQMDSGNTYLPEYALYRCEKQRPRVSVMLEENLSESWRAGLGIDLGFGVTSEATVFMQSGDGKYSNQRISASVKPKIVPMGILEYDGYRLMVKAENKVKFTLNAAAGASVFPPLNASFDVTYASNSALFFDPWTFDLSRRYQVSDTWILGLGVSYQLWSGYETRAAVIRDISGTFSNGQDPARKTTNLLVPRIAIEKKFGERRYELGYEFKDSIFKTTPYSGNGNYLDPPRHSFTLGAIFPFASGWELGTSVQVTRLTPQSVVKLNSTEIGAPGYEASGWLYGGKLSLTVPFEGSKKL